MTWRAVRVLGPDGTGLGLLSPQEALEKAYALGLDLVEVVPEARPPICQIMDYAKDRKGRRREER